MQTQIPNEHFEMKAGDGKSVVVDVLDQNDDAADLTGATCRIGFAVSETASQNLFTNAGTISTDDNGNVNRCALPINEADTQALRGVYHFEVEVISSGGVPSTVLEGSVDVQPSMVFA